MTAVQIPKSPPGYTRFTYAGARIRREDAARAISRMWECAGGDPDQTREIAQALFAPLEPPPRPVRHRPGRQRPSERHE
jgi:hypothetical protein